MHRNIDRPNKRTHALDLFNMIGEATGDLDPPRGNTSQDESIQVRLFFDDLVSHPPDGFANRPGIQSGGDCFSFWHQL